MNWTIWSHLPTWLVYAVNIGAVHRLSRLVARDAIFDRPRDAFSSRYEGMLVTLVLCMWCLAVWFAVGAVLLTSWGTTRETWLVIASVLTIADIAGLMSERA